MKCSYDTNDIIQCIEPSDTQNYKRQNHEIHNECEWIAEEFIKSKFQVKKLNNRRIGESYVFTAGSLYDCLTIRRTNKILKNNIEYHIFSPYEEIKQLQSILENEKEIWIFRSGIKSFYESINFEEMIDTLITSGLISYTPYYHLQSISKEIKKIGYSGLPRGLEISESISEFVLLNFYKNIFQIDSCIYYSRNAENFIIILSRDCPSIEEDISEILLNNLQLNKTKLQLNKTETKYEKIATSITINYLAVPFFFKII